MERKTNDFRTLFNIGGAQAVIRAAVLADVGGFSSAGGRWPRLT